MRKWIERRFWEFRYGHGTYLSYGLGLFNFVVVNYALLISNVGFLMLIFPHFWIFAVIFTAVYIPTATIVGYVLFRKRQLKTDAEIAALENPYRFRSVVPSRETVLDLPLQKINVNMVLRIARKHDAITKEEEEQLKRYLSMIDRLLSGESLESELKGNE